MKIQLSDHFSYRKLLKFTLPSIAMMIFTSIYSVVDGFFISNFAGKIPFAAINLIMPVLMILGTVGFMFGTGGTALVALTYGEGDRKKANEYFSLLVYSAAALGIILALLGFCFIRDIAGDVSEFFCGSRETAYGIYCHADIRCDEYGIRCSACDRFPAGDKTCGCSGRHSYSAVCRRYDPIDLFSEEKFKYIKTWKDEV